MAAFGRAKESILRDFLRLRHAIASHGAFSIVLRMIDPKSRDAAFGRVLANGVGWRWRAWPASSSFTKANWLVMMIVQKPHRFRPYRYARQRLTTVMQSDGNDEDIAGNQPAITQKS